MATYVPNAFDPAQPTEDKPVETAAEEFRTLKDPVIRSLRFPAADLAGNRAEMPAAAARAGRFLAFDSVTGQPIPGPLLSAWIITQTQIAAIEIAAGSIASINAVAANIATINAAVADLPNLATKVSKTSDTGSAVMPAGTTAQRDAGVVPGRTRFNATNDELEVQKNAGNWDPVGSGARGGVGNPIIFENDIVVTQNYALTAGKNGLSAGPISINTGVTVTIPNGSVWSIV